MASRRRTQEEKTLKTLRELASLPANKQCFDCRQRGPTYINVTIGSFVCTSCSGILRGLNPPHRVKSITMTTFSMEEIEFIKSRGNEYCQYVWMGLYDSRALEPESRDEQKTRDFMIQKYERKRWYVDPDIAMKKMQQDHQRQSTLPSSSSQGSLVPETKPLSTLLGNSAANLVVQHNQGNSNSTWPPAVTSSTAHFVSLPANTHTRVKGKFELTNDIEGDSFNNSNSTAESVTANGNFANFESAFNTPVSSVAAVHPTTTGIIQTETSVTPGLPAYSSASKVINSQISASQTAQPPSADRYAALADLDTLFHQTQPPVTSSSSWVNTESDMFGNSTTIRNDSVGNFTGDIASNPFSSESLGWNKPASTQSQKVYPTANPFQAVISTSGIPTQQNSVFGVANTVEDNFTNFSGNASFPPFPLSNMTSSLNGIAPSQYGTQNGGFGIRPPLMIWGTQGTWGSGVVNNQTITQTTFQETKLEQAGNHWLQQNMPTAANPFLDRNGSTVPRTNPSNPFL